MASDAFSGAKSAFTLFIAYINTVAQEIGIERAVSLNTKMCETLGAMQGKMLKEQAGIKEFDAKTAFPLVKSVPESLGVSFEVVEESPQRVVAKAGKCSLYAAAQALGVDAKTIEGMCHASSLRFMDTIAKQLNPNLSWQLRKFRSAPDDSCVEELVLG